MTTVRLCREDELELGAARRFDVEGAKLCLVHGRDGFYAIDDTCSHEDFSLADGEVDLAACEIECWRHGSMFSLLSGEPTTFPATRPVATYAVEMRDGDVFVVLA